MLDRLETSINKKLLPAFMFEQPMMILSWSFVMSTHLLKNMKTRKEEKVYKTMLSSPPNLFAVVWDPLFWHIVARSCHSIKCHWRIRAKSTSNGMAAALAAGLLRCQSDSYLLQ